MGTHSANEAAEGDLLAGRYRIAMPIGTGGMGRVYLADDERLARRVAVKVVDADPADSTARARAVAETRLLASLTHPNLVTLLDSHLDHDPPFFVMEHVSGPSLAQRLCEGPLGAAALHALAVDLADGLRAVHAAGIVHRDVKPSNILLEGAAPGARGLRAKLADFGIAHLVDSERLTSAQVLIGTAAYVAPEQLQGAAPAPASDIYSLGLVLLEAATGERAFGHDDGAHPLFVRLARDPGVPAWLDDDWSDLLRRMTARDPSERPDAATVAGWLSGPPRTNRRSRRARAEHVDIATVDIALPPDARAAALTGTGLATTRVVAPSAGDAGSGHVPAARSRRPRRRFRGATWAVAGSAAVALALQAGVLLTHSHPGPVSPSEPTVAVPPEQTTDVSVSEIVTVTDPDEVTDPVDRTRRNGPTDAADPIDETTTSPAEADEGPPQAGGNDNAPTDSNNGNNSNSNSNSNSNNGNGNGNASPGERGASGRGQDNASTAKEGGSTGRADAPASDERGRSR